MKKYLEVYVNDQRVEIKPTELEQINKPETTKISIFFETKEEIKNFISAFKKSVRVKEDYINSSHQERCIDGVTVETSPTKNKGGEENKKTGAVNETGNKRINAFIKTVVEYFSN